jgi:hypothetical protein
MSKLELYVPHEKEPKANPAWLGGFFDIGGSAWINRQVAPRVHSQYVSYLFGLNYSENDKQIVDSLSKYLGGNVYERTGVHSFDWRLFGKKALVLGTLMEDYSPSRQWAIDIMQSINASTDAEEKEEFYRQYRKREGKAENTDIYKDLVNNPQFLAGVLDARARISDYSYSGPRLELYSSNRPLISAIEQKYKGSMIVLDKAGTTEMVKDVEYPVKKDRFEWQARTHTIEELYRDTEKFLVLRKKEFRDILSQY